MRTKLERDGMEQDLIDAGVGLFLDVEAFVRSLATTWQLYQLGIMLALYAVAQLLRAIVGPRLEDWVRDRHGWPRWRLRLAVIVIRRLRGLFFVLLMWTTVGLMAELTAPPRTALLELGAALATAWMAVSFGAQSIRNRSLRQVVTWGAWIYIGLFYLGFLDGTAAFLDSIAVTFDDFRISALSLLQAAIVTAVVFLAARLLLRILVARISGSEDMSPSMQVLATKVLQALFFGAVIVIGLQAVGFDLTGLAVLSGAIGVGIGFGLQKVVSNLVSGVIILLDKSVKPGDVISLGDTFGWINELSARYVSVVTRDGREFLIPNEDLVTGQVVNWSHSDDFVRIDLTFATSYRDDPHLVRRVAVEAARSLPRVLAERSVACHITGFNDSAIGYVLRVWIADAQAGLASVRGAIYLALWDAFKAHGITIPFPQREVRLLGDGEAGGAAARPS
ncbi:MAG: mechanosensitive ion channel family protein [Geminicoccaceae bacterium]|nr:MAG: mechanosensitive ion channel family protein [Geminicoccaceae bacterium]